jgi:hypothetical protein
MHDMPENSYVEALSVRARQEHLLSNGSASFLATSALAGLGNQYPDLEEWYQANLNGIYFCGTGSFSEAAPLEK